MYFGSWWAWKTAAGEKSSEQETAQGGNRSAPSPSSAGRYLYHFHDPEQEKLKEAGTSFIPAPTPRLRAMMQVNGDFLGSVQKRSPQEVATLDLDATVVETNKREALYCYKGHKAYQPLQVVLGGTGSHCPL